MKQKACIGLLLLTLSSWQPAAAEEFAVVTGEHGYLLGDDGEVIATVPQMTIVDVISDDDAELRVGTSDGIVGLIRGQLVHRSSRFSYITDENRDVVREALTLVSDSTRLPDDDPSRAIALVQQAVSRLEESFEDPLPVSAWVLAYLAWLQHSGGDPTTAMDTIQMARRQLDQLNQPKHLQAADVFNMLAILLQEQGKPGEALSAYQEALLIAAGDLGPQHSDVRIICTNIAGVYAELGDLTQAARAQKLARSIGQTILPDSAVERIDDAARLAQYLTDDEQYATATPLREELAGLHERIHPDDVFAAVENAIRLAELYRLVDQPLDAERILLRFLVRLSNEPATVADPHRGRIQNVLGLLSFDEENYVGAARNFITATRLLADSDPDANTAVIHENAGNALVAQNKNVEALEYYQSALQIFLEVEGEDSVAAAELRDTINGLVTPEAADPAPATNPSN